MNLTTRISVAILIALLSGIVFVLVRPHISASPMATQPVTVSYICKTGNAVTATYSYGASKSSPIPDQPPVPSGSVALHFSDGRTMVLPQTISADGSRYANADESLVVWSKGNSLLVLEGDEEKSFAGCIAVAPQPVGADMNRVYANSAKGFSIRIPEEYVVDANYQYQELGPDSTIDGIKFTVPQSMARGTNLASDTYISVEEIPHAGDCRGALFLGPEASTTEMIDGGTTYSIASATGAGAGNRYEETVYALSGTSPCVAVRYFVHYGVIENYTPGAVRAFDKKALLGQFDAIRHTLMIAQ